MSDNNSKLHTNFPGRDAVNASFEEPVALLFECHNRIRRTLDLLEKLTAYLSTNGCDEKVRSGANDVLRYFDIAAPLHHQDEELHVFPALKNSNIIGIHAHVLRMQVDHLRMADEWSILRTPLVALASADMVASWSKSLEDQVISFRKLYDEHLTIEEQLLFPALERYADRDDLEKMGIEMQQRRSITKTNL